MHSPNAWPASLWASFFLHALVGLFVGNLTRALLASQRTADATPLGSLGFSLAAAAAVGGILLIANLIAGRAAGWTQRPWYLVPPLGATALIAVGGFLGTWQYLRN